MQEPKFIRIGDSYYNLARIESVDARAKPENGKRRVTVRTDGLGCVETVDVDAWDIIASALLDH